MNHSFDIDIAKEYGLNEAIILNNIYFWCEHNRANGLNIHDGDAWTYNTVKAFAELFPYMSERQIYNALKHLENEGLIKTGCYNENPWDRKKWYSVTEKGKCILQKCKMDNDENVKCTSCENVKSYTTDIKHTDINNTDNKQHIYSEIIAYLNDKCGTRYKATESTKRIIHERIQEGFTKDDCFKVIDNKVATWKGTEWEKFLRPDTLFRASKFQGYLNEKPVEKKHAGSREGYSVDITKYDTL